MLKIKHDSVIFPANFLDFFESKLLELQDVFAYFSLVEGLAVSHVAYQFGAVLLR